MISAATISATAHRSWRSRAPRDRRQRRGSTDCTYRLARDNDRRLESTATACATDETSQQCALAPSGLRVADHAVGVADEQRPIALVLHPAGVALLMVLDEQLATPELRYHPPMIENSI